MEFKVIKLADKLMKRHTFKDWANTKSRNSIIVACFLLFVAYILPANAQDFRNDPKENERVIGDAIDTINVVFPSNYSQMVYSTLLEKAKKEYPNKVVDLRSLKISLNIPSHGNVASAIASAKVVEFLTAEELEHYRSEIAEAERIAADITEEEIIETERIAAAKAEEERIEAERIAAAKAEEDRIEAERIAAAKAEEDRIEAERIAAAKAEEERIEADRIAAAKAEEDRIETERIAAVKTEEERIETERIAAAKAEEERIETERIAAVKAEEERIEAERIAATQRPPIVSIIDPINGTIIESEQVTINYYISVTAPTSVRVMVDGRAVQLITDAKLGENTVIVDIPDRDSRISIVAQNEFGASVPAAVNLIRSEHIFKPSLYVLAIGVSNYDNPELRLRFPAKDASDFSQAMIRQAGLLYESVDVRLLTDRRATAENIRDGLSWLQSETTSRDVAMLFIAGHGVNDNVGDFFFMPVGADVNRINATCVSYMDIKRTTSAVAGKLIVFMDACHSGNVLGNTTQRAGLVNQAVSELTGADNGPVVFTSSTGRQFSLESPEWNNGAFTRALVEGLNGSADLIGRNMITVRSLDVYIADRVKELTQGRQAPTTIIPRSIPDFPIAIVIDESIF